MDEDQILRDLLNSSASQVEIDDSPTIFSLQDIISLMEKKYGKDWMKVDFAKIMVIYQSRLFLIDHVKEVCENYPGLFELCEEYYLCETIEGKALPEDFVMKIFEFANTFVIEEENITFQTSPVRNAYWSFK